MLPRVLLAVLLLAAFHTDVYAVPHEVDTCGVTCGGGEQCVLIDDIDCATSPGITLATGADLDFKGKKITCNACSNTASAVLVTNTNTTVEDTVGGGGVRGAWGVGINCQLYSNSVARDVMVDGPKTGIGGCRKVQGVAVTNTVDYGITNTSMISSDYIKRSMIIGSATGILLGGSGAGTVDHNVISKMTANNIHTTATTSTSLTISSNTLFTDGGGVLINTGTTKPTTSGNVCGAPEVTVCDNCIDAGDCEAAETPFVGP